MLESGPISNAIFRVARLHRMHAGQLLRRVGLHPGQEMVMMQLWEHGPQRQSDLVRMLGSDAATMTRTVQRLEHAGFVRRTPCAGDRRVTIVEPTAASLALRGELDAVWSELEQRTVGDLSPEQVADALRVLEALESALSKPPSDCGGG